MRILFSAYVWLALCGTAHAAITVTDRGAGTISFSGTLPVTLNGTPTPGHCLLLSFGSRSAGLSGVVNSIAQNGVTWTPIARQLAGSATIGEIWIGSVGSGASTSLTLSFGAGSNYTGDASVAEVDGLAGCDNTSNTVDVAAVGKTASAGQPSTGPYTTVTSGDLIYVMTVHNDTNPSISAQPSGYTTLGAIPTFDGGTAPVLQPNYRVVSSAGAQSASWTFSGNSTVEWVSIIVGLRPAGSISTMTAVRHRVTQ